MFAVSSSGQTTSEVDVSAVKKKKDGASSLLGGEVVFVLCGVVAPTALDSD